MGIGDIICEYIYGSFLLLKAALEVAQKTSKAMLKALDTLFNTLISLCRFVVDVSIKTILDAIRVFQKWLVDKLLNLDFSALCDGMFRCSALLEEVLDPNSLLSRTLQKFTNYNARPQAELYAIVNDFRQFKDTICNFGFTYNFGLTAVKSMLNQYSSMIGSILNMLEKYKEQIRRFLQKYLDTLINIGVFDMLDRLKKYFDCVLIDTDICSNIRTANSFYNTMLSKMFIEESGDGYRLDSNKIAYYMNIFDSRINNLNNAKIELQRLIDSMLSPSQVSASKNAFNIASNIFPGGATYKDIKNGDFWKKNKCYQYFKIKRRDFINSFKEEHPEIANQGTDSILGGMYIDDLNGIITIDFVDNEGNNKQYRYDKDNLPPNISYEYDSDAEYILNQNGEKYEFNSALYDEENDIVISTLRGGIDIAIHNNETLKAQVQRKFNMAGYTREDELVKMR